MKGAWVNHPQAREDGGKRKERQSKTWVYSHTFALVSCLSLSEDIQLPRTKCGLCNPLLFWEFRDRQCTSRPGWRTENKIKGEPRCGKEGNKMESKKQRITTRLSWGDAYISISPAFRFACFPFAAALRRFDAEPLFLAFLAEWTGWRRGRE